MNTFEVFMQSISNFVMESGFAQLNLGYIVMIVIACVLLYLAIAKGFEPLLLVPIAFGILMVNLPGVGIKAYPANGEPGGLLYYIGMGKDLGIYPPLIFIGVGAMTDFGPLIANPKSLLLGAAAQIGIFVAFLGALLLGFSPEQAAAIGIIGGADGPTSIYTATKLAPELLGAIAVSAYSYMALVPVIQPPIMKMFTTAEERKIKMDQLRPVSSTEKVLFPIIVTISVSLLLPSAGTLVGMLMFGNLLKEVGATSRLADVASNALMSIITILLGISVGASTGADQFLTTQTLGILALGLFAFVIGTGSGVLFGKLMCKMSGGKINPLIGAAGVSAVPMAARVVQKVGQKENPSNFLLMHAMGPNVAGVIGSAIAAGVMLSIYAN
ncbi:sodium ion-translocating decarboxylase subunit beta [Candidatus Epulonipiscium viviparus]|uniref:sodium ion-translocating decarboxylase subunit beta n=1 Tax=Candidatus Epulonipiscium viviparus TaxID=420336 RepID=UPI0027380B9E|nr:sodium ion-translocating decarboxylase subunit beta [Candidatus Epulopiscium viviparus]